MNAMLWKLAMQVWMQDSEDDPTRDKTNRGILEFVKERDPTLLGDNVGSLGNKGSPTIALIAVWRQSDRHYLLLMWDNLMKVKIWKKWCCLLLMWERKKKYKRDDIICCRCGRTRQNIKEMTLSNVDAREQDKI